MRLHRIRLRHVLSFEEVSLTCDHHVTALVGPNDAGKTNILRILHHLAGPTPSLDMTDLRSQFFPEEEPSVDLFFVTEANDRGPLVDILGWQQLPQPPFNISLSCRSKSVVLQAANEPPRKLVQEEGEQKLGSLLQTVYVQPELRPMQTSIPFNDIIEGVPSPEAHLFSMAGLNKGHLTSIFRGSQRGDDARRDAAKLLNEEFQKVWKQEKSKIQLYPRLSKDIRDCALDIKVEDGGDVCVSLEHRGAGLRWFLALLVQLRETPRRENTLCNLFLIDEPGVFLHPLGQADLYSLISDLSEKPTNQVIYATHSPFMLDWSRPHEIRIVERRRDGAIPASIIVDKAYHENKALLFWEPFRRSLGLFIGDFGLLGEKNLLVEGPTDQIIFSYLGRVTSQLSDWKIIPCNDTEVCVFIARICKRIGRTVAVLVDSDQGGDAYLDALTNAECADVVPIHNLHEFCLRPIDRAPFCLEEFLSLKQYVAAVNDAYGEMDWYNNSSISEAEIAALEPTTSIAGRLEELFKKRAWKDNQSHTFAKAFVSIHLASSRRSFDVNNFDGNFGAISERLSKPEGPIKLGIEISPGQGHWSALFSLTLDPLKRGVGVKRITVHATNSRIGELVFPPTDMTEVASAPAASVGSAQTSPEGIQEQTSLEGTPATATSEQDAKGSGLTEYTSENVGSANGQEQMPKATDEPGETSMTLKRRGVEQDVVRQSVARTKVLVAEKMKIRMTAATGEGTPVKNLGTDLPAEDQAKDAIAVFDCWQREWVPNTSTSFLTKCAGIVKIQGSEPFERTNLSFSITYCDGNTQDFEILFSYDGKRTKSVKKRDRITGTVIWFNQDKGYGFIRPESGERDVFVHISAVMEAGLDTLDEGDTVEFELVTNYDGRTSADNLKM